MSAAAILTAIESRFATEFLALNPTMVNRISWPGVRFDEPADGAWVRLTVRFGDTEQASFGGDTNVHRSAGVIFVQVFSRMERRDGAVVNYGYGEALALAESAAGIFRSTSFSGVNTRAASIQMMDANKGWVGATVSIPFWADYLY